MRAQLLLARFHLVFLLFLNPGSSSEPLGGHASAVRTPLHYRRHLFAAEHLADINFPDDDDDDDSSSKFHPLRITAYYNEALIPSAKLSFLRSVLMKRAIAFYRAKLSVIRHDHGHKGQPPHLKLRPFCAQDWATPNSTCRVWKDVQCGMTLVPPAHRAAHSYCTNCVGTDKLTGQCDRTTSDCHTSPAGKGIRDTDIVLYVTAVHTQDCEGGTEAFAGVCAIDQVFALLIYTDSFCPNGDRQIILRLNLFVDSTTGRSLVLSTSAPTQ